MPRRACPPGVPCAHRLAGLVEEVFQRRGHVAEARRAAEDESVAGSEVFQRCPGRAFFRYRALRPLVLGGHRRHAAQLRRGARHGLDAAAHLPRQLRRAAVARVVDDEDLAAAAHRCAVVGRQAEVVRAVPARGPARHDQVRIFAAAHAAVVARQRLVPRRSSRASGSGAGWRSPSACWLRPA